MKSKCLFTIKHFFIFLILVFSAVNLWSESTTPEPYTYEEFPDALHKLRRFEIITLGAMPFVSLDISLGYSGYKYLSGQSQTFVNPFSSNVKDTYTENEIKGIIISSLGVSLCVGISDFVVNQIKESSKRKRILKNAQNIVITPVTPIEDDPDAIKISNPNIEKKLPSEDSEEVE